MLTVGDRFPSFKLNALEGGARGLDPKTAFRIVTDADDSTQWKLVFFWPKDFSTLCPTEIVTFGRMAPDFAERGAVIYGVSLDSELAHMNWRLAQPELRDLPFPMLSDIKRELSSACGILDHNEGVPLRATFLVDTESTIRHVSVNDLAVGRNPQEVLRVLDALQAGALCPCNWQKGDEVLRAA
ncbi:peroxiredoxin (alkyl hydroperoxide reductase subunit C) [Roseomonas rosea]|uniref:Alkyl hydroperoxide reductase C n=1 Tax=Muricoccus roseus TaxID=198092 RepID=A0A1M6E6F1_9PROT|nr:peroxiredoxin [Roseomonas rosea]SHI80940.1 peroxiredoxin (alkyl hydroperoxide reductase subunit C) [Roseomonas rosea]